MPRLCPNCRHCERFAKRSPMTLYKSKCQCAGAESDNGLYKNIANHQAHESQKHCTNEFETPYSPERNEIVYCESCYQKEVL